MQFRSILFVAVAIKAARIADTAICAIIASAYIQAVVARKTCDADGTVTGAVTFMILECVHCRSNW